MSKMVAIYGHEYPFSKTQGQIFGNEGGYSCKNEQTSLKG